MGTLNCCERKHNRVLASQNEIELSDAIYELRTGINEVLQKSMKNESMSIKERKRFYGHGQITQLLQNISNINKHFYVLYVLEELVNFEYLFYNERFSKFEEAKYAFMEYFEFATGDNNLDQLIEKTRELNIHLNTLH